MNICMERADSIFVDSNILIALFNHEDALHGSVQKLWKDIEREYSFVISNFVFLETVTVLSQRRNKAVAQEAGREILRNPAFRHIHVDENLQEESWRIFQETENKNVSFVDCSTIALMQFKDISKLLTFDKEFKTLQKHYRFSLYR